MGKQMVTFAIVAVLVIAAAGYHVATYVPQDPIIVQLEQVEDD